MALGTFSSLAACFSARSYRPAILSRTFSVCLRLVLDLLFGQLLVVELHDLFDRPRAVAQIFGDGDQFLDHDGRARDGLQHQQLPALDALGDGHFAFARQQRNGAHLAQIHAHRIVGLFQQSRRQVQFDFFGCRPASSLTSPSAGSATSSAARAALAAATSS